eukprot:gene9993-11713_t
MGSVFGWSEQRNEQTYPDGKVVIGARDENQVRQGWTKVTLSDGTLATGVLLDGEWHGAIKYVVPTGEVVEGIMKHGIQRGHWTKRSPSGEVVHNCYVKGSLFKANVPFHIARATADTFDRDSDSSDEGSDDDDSEEWEDTDVGESDTEGDEKR